MNHCLFIFNSVFIIKGIIYISVDFNLRGSRTKATEFKNKISSEGHKTISELKVLWSGKKPPFFSLFSCELLDKIRFYKLEVL